MKIVYVHHGNRKFGNPKSQDDDLTEIGYSECELVSKLLETAKSKINFKAIYSSPFFRCKKTAEIINSSLNLPIIFDERLNEAGSIEGETWTDVQLRGMELIDELLGVYNKDDAVICVTSGVNVACFINKLYGISASENIPKIGIPSCCPMIFDFEN